MCQVTKGLIVLASFIKAIETLTITLCEDSHMHSDLNLCAHKSLDLS